MLDFYTFVCFLYYSEDTQVLILSLSCGYSSKWNFIQLFYFNHLKTVVKPTLVTEGLHTVQAKWLNSFELDGIGKEMFSHKMEL